MKLTRVEVGFGKILMSFLYNQKIILYYLIEKISHLFAGFATLFLIDDIIPNEALDKRRQFLLELAISGHHRQHSLWLLTQSYTAIPNNIRRQAKMLYVWYPKKQNRPEYYS